MDRVWDTFKYPPKPSVTLCQIKVTRGHEVKKVKFKILSFGDVIHIFGSDFRQKCKKTLEHFLNGPNRTKMKKM